MGESALLGETGHIFQHYCRVSYDKHLKTL